MYILLLMNGVSPPSHSVGAIFLICIVGMLSQCACVTCAHFEKTFDISFGFSACEELYSTLMHSVCTRTLLLSLAFDVWNFEKTIPLKGYGVKRPICKEL